MHTYSPVIPRNSAVDPSTGTHSDDSHISGVRVKMFWLSWDTDSTRTFWLWGNSVSH